MTTAYQTLQTQLRDNPKTWLITGVAGFIGSNLLETLLKLNQRVVGLDNFAIGHQRNLDEVQTLVTAKQWAGFHFIQGDIRNLENCRRAMVFHPLPLGEGRGEGWRRVLRPESLSKTRCVGTGVLHARNSFTRSLPPCITSGIRSP